MNSLLPSRRPPHTAKNILLSGAQKMNAMATAPDWVVRHRAVFSRKESLRFYYLDVFGSLLTRHLRAGRTLEIGSGPGFLSGIVEDLVTSDYEKFPGIDVACDAHELLFPEASFANVFCVDVLHHLRSPLTCLREISRVLTPGGRAVMIEPYTTPLSRIFYKYIHHESCYFPQDVWSNAFPGDKDPMMGNAEIPRTLLKKNSGPVTGDNPLSGLKLCQLTPFAGLSYLLTGGFQNWQFPLPLVRSLYFLEEKTRRLWAPLAATRCLAVFERSE